MMARQDSTRKFNLFFYVLLKSTLIPYLILKYRIKSENKKLFKRLKPPFVLIPNHVSMFDPPMVGAFVPHRVHFVMSDANLRTKIGKWAYIKMCRVIPKTKAVSDASTVRQIFNLIRKNRVICIFAEGRSTWDGVTHDIFFSTSKLLKILKVPVVVPLIRGGYLTHPRWGTSVRPGRMVIHYKKVFDGPELSDMTPEDIHNRLIAEIWNDDYLYQKETGATFKTKKGAEYLERVLFACPGCEQKETLHSQGNRLFCSACGAEHEWTPEGYLKPVNQPELPTRTMTEWVHWQHEFCERNIRLLQQDNRIDKPIFSDEQVTLKLGYKLEPLKELMHGTMQLFIDRFVFSADNGEEQVFPITQVEGVQVLLANQFEFYFQGSLYKFDFSNPRASGYKYMCAIQKIAPEKTELE
jgi:1-acyl-sn-glycerol-3-phosphate acyltransferase